VVRELIARARHWWAAQPPQPAAEEPFDVACSCGQRARGARQPRYQVVRCLGCGNPVFVLGRSPIADVRGTSSGSKSLSRRYWLGPVIAAGLTLAAVVAVFSLLIPILTRPAPPAETGTADALTFITMGREALRRDKSRDAVESFVKARRAHESRPESLTPVEARELARLERQSALIADLLSESLDQILQLTAATPEEERQRQFNDRYRDKAVIFDDVVVRDAAGRFGLAVYEVRGPGEPARVELSDLKLLQKLPLAEPQRMLFGGRLASLGREERGGHGLWVIHFDPDSGVLLTDEDTAGACCPRPLDADLKAVLSRQAEWAAGMQ
jgi:hypothetical protein